MFDDSLKAISKLSAIKTDDQFLKFRIQEKIIVNKLSYYLFVGKYVEGVKYIKEIEDEFIENESQYNSLFFTSAIHSFEMIYFFMGDFSQALKWINKIFSFKNSLRPDIICFTKVLNLMVHYEMKNYDHLEYILKSTENFLVKQHSFKSYYKEMVLFLKKIVIIQNREELKKEFLSLSARLVNYETMDETLVIFQLFNFRKWADKKVLEYSL